MIKYQEKIQDFYKMRDTLIAEGYCDIESLKTYEKVELREIALEIIISKRVDMWALIGSIKSGYKDYELLRGNSKIPLTIDELKLIKGLIEL